ncbi:hypothetical protein NW753_008290 [Fusarium oxysporum]|nr:hypothetical protein NW758_009556 [Fusarium oxysporum]KAJ4049279.1 hypothetical protein NW753_008290 [Fusarium oxysporum]KAJ4049864.1 hypothetical protein NW763_009175 [Fusarium oxysporum]
MSVSSKRTLVSTFGGRHERFLPLPILRKPMTLEAIEKLKEVKGVIVKDVPTEEL